MNKFFKIFTIIIAASAIVMVHSVCKPCHGYMAMPCEHSTFIAEIALYALIIASGSTLFVKRAFAHTLTAVLNIAAGVFLQFISAFGHCQVASMSCNMKTFSMLRITGALIGAFSAIALIINVVKIVSRRRTHANAQ